MAVRLKLLLLIYTCAACLPVAHGAERAGDAAYLNELKRYANTFASLEMEFLSSIEAASGEDSFYLYWTYNHSI